MIETLKKQWFVVLVAVICVSFVVFCVYDTNKGKLPGKKADGKEVIATMSDYTLTADDLYPTLYKNYAGTQNLYLRFQNQVIDQSVKTTDELKEKAKTIASNMQAQAESYASMYGTTAEAMIQQQLTYYGFESDDMDGYSLMAAKNEKLRNDYIDARLDELYTPVYEATKPRIVSHILINVKDINNPTEEEQKKIDAVEKELKEGKDFAEVAKEYSDDTGSKENGGYLGYSDNKTNYVTSFKEKMLSMKAGEVSDWVKESNSSYSGWHKILVSTTDKQELIDNKDVRDGIYSAIVTANSDIAFKYVWEAAQKLDITYANDEVKKEIMDYMGIKE